MEWYGIFVQTGKEDYVKNILLNEINDNIKVLVPKRKLTEKRDGTSYEIIRTVFPSYVFIYCNMNEKINRELIETDKVYKVLGESFNPIPIPENEMDLISSIFGEEEFADYTKVYYKNEHIMIAEGPLKGYEANICKFDKRKHRARVIIKLNGNDKKIDLGIKIINGLENQVG